jgi:hypothetical protein
MTYIRKHLLFTVVAAILLMTAGIKETMAFTYGETGSELFSSDMHSGGSQLESMLAVITVRLTTHAGKSFHQINSVLAVGPTSGAYNDPDQNLFEQSWQRFLKASFKVKVLLVILAYLVISVILLFISILIHRQIKTRQRQKQKELRDEYQEQLASLLFDDNVEKIQFKGINKRNYRQILINELMDLHNNLHGEVGDKLKDLYFNLGLHKDSLHKVYRGRWDEKAKGFGELAQMDVKDANEKIRSYVNSKNPVLRMESQVAMVKLSEEHPLAFLDNLHHELSYWEQINIYDTIVFHSLTIDSYEIWLDNKNQSVVVFALRMIGLFKHVHSADKVRELLFSQNSEIALAAIEAMKSLEMAEYIDDMILLYQSETHKLVNILETQRKNKSEREIRSLDDIIPRKIRYEVVLALRAIASSKEIAFLEQVVLDKENSYKIRILAISVLLGIFPEGEAKVNDLLISGDEIVKKMIINVKQNQES